MPCCQDAAKKTKWVVELISGMLADQDAAAEAAQSVHTSELVLPRLYLHGAATYKSRSLLTIADRFTWVRHMQAACKQETADAVAEGMVSHTMSICPSCTVWPAVSQTMACVLQEAAAQARQAKDESAALQKSLAIAKVFPSVLELASLKPPQGPTVVCL